MDSMLIYTLGFILIGTFYFALIGGIVGSGLDALIREHEYTPGIIALIFGVGVIGGSLFFLAYHWDVNGGIPWYVTLFFANNALSGMVVAMRNTFKIPLF